MSTTVSGGETSSGLVATTSNTIYVQSGGTVIDLSVLSGGFSIVYEGATAVGTVIGSGGLVEGHVTDVLSNTTILSGGELSGYNGGDLTGLTADAGSVAGNLLVTGTLSGAHIGNGNLSAGAGGVISGVAIDGVTVISSGGLGTGDTINSQEYVYSGGVTSAENITGGDSQIVSAGGRSIDPLIASGGAIYNSGPVSFDDANIITEGGFITETGDVVISGTGTVEYTMSDGYGGGTTLEDGTLRIDSGATAGTGAITFAGTADVTIGSLTGPANVLSGFAAGDTVDLAAYSHTLLGDSISVSGDTVTVHTPTGDVTLDIAGAASEASHFFLAPALDGSILLGESPCYCAGTLILTDRGEMPVEALQIGDRLVTLSGAARPLRWIGTRAYDGRFVTGNRAVLPVLFRAGSLADGIPRRDLMVSPLHAMHLDGMLLPAATLVNGRSIVQPETADRIEYVHLELDTHDIILAEGAASETFVDGDSRGMFHNVADYHVRHPGAARVAARYCAPRIEEGEALERVRRRLAARAAGSPPASPFDGRIDDVTRDVISGWAFDPAAPERPMRLRVLDRGVAIAELVADQFRGDLLQAGIGDGRHGFTLVVPGGLSPEREHTITLQRAEDGATLAEPRTLLAPIPAERRAPPGALTSDPGRVSCHGSVDLASRTRISGWAHDNAPPHEAVALQLLEHDTAFGRVLANRHRPDLEQLGIGTGRYGFELEIPGSPAVIEPATSFDAALEQAVAGAVAALGAEDDRARVLSFITGQAEQLRQQSADASSRSAEQAAQHRLARQGEASAALAPRALVIDERLPLRDRDAGSQAILSHMRSLQRLGYAVSFVAAGDMQGAGADALDEAGIARCGAPVYAGVEDVLRRQARVFDLVYLHRAGIAAAYTALVRRHQPRAHVLYSVADLHHVRLERQAAIEDRPELSRLARQLRLTECTAAWSADSVITHSSVEAAALRHALPHVAVHRVPWELSLRPQVAAFEERHGVAFIGSYDHAPNRDAAHWLVDEIMPRVWQQDPAITCLLVGSAMPASIRRLERPGIVVLGHVDDLGSRVFDRVRLTVAPLRFGAGVKGKVLESLAALMPCVMSPVAAEGLELPPALDALVGRDAAGLAALICRLHGDGLSHAPLVRAGAALIEAGHGATTVDAALQAAIGDRLMVQKAG